MPLTFRNRRTLLLGLFAIAVVAAGTVEGQTLTGTVDEITHPAYAGVSSHFTISNAEASGSFVFEGDIVIFCSDLDGTSLDDGSISFTHELTSANSTLSVGSIDDFDVWSRYGTPQDKDLAKAQAHWLIDNYYDSYFVNTPSGERHARQYAFQNALWEIMGDGATTNGLDFSSGNIDRSKFSPTGSSSAPELWSHMNILINAVSTSGIDSSYQEELQIYAVLDSREDYQDYFAFATTREVMVIPEPSTSSVFLIAAGLLIARRQRS